VFVYPKNKGLIFPAPHTFLVECDSRLSQDLYRHLQKYILRSKVKLQDVTPEYSVWSAWGTLLQRLTQPSPSRPIPPGGLLMKDIGVGDVWCKDSRMELMGLRMVEPIHKSRKDQNIVLQFVRKTIR